MLRALKVESLKISASHLGFNILIATNLDLNQNKKALGDEPINS